MFAVGLQQPEQLHGRRHLLDFGQDQPRAAARGAAVHLLECLRENAIEPEQLHRHEGSAPNRNTRRNQTAKTMGERGTGYGAAWTAGVWTAGTWTAGVWSAATWTPKNHNTWNGCVMDRGNPTTPDTINNYDTNVVQPDVTKIASLYAAEQYGSCPQAAMELNYNWSSMTSLVNAMSPNGNTNQAIGLELGWMSLVGGGPFYSPPMDPNYTYTQVIILLTDGLNTQDRWYSDQSSIDTRQQLTCNNINAAGITLYTIQVNTGGDPTSTLLQNCAGSPGKYPDSGKFYLLTSSSQILTVFTQIGTDLSQLRLAK